MRQRARYGTELLSDALDPGHGLRTAEAVSRGDRRTSTRGHALRQQHVMLATLGGVYAASGKFEEARSILRQLDEMAERRYVSPVLNAEIYAGLGENERALAC